jgi:hypothetical protein
VVVIVFMMVCTGVLVAIFINREKAHRQIIYKLLNMYEEQRKCTRLIGKIEAIHVMMRNSSKWDIQYEDINAKIRNVTGLVPWLHKRQRQAADYIDWFCT